MSSKLTFENSSRLLNAQIGLDCSKLFEVFVGMTPSCESDFFNNNFKNFLLKYRGSKWLSILDSLVPFCWRSASQLIGIVIMERVRLLA